MFLAGDLCINKTVVKLLKLKDYKEHDREEDRAHQCSFKAGGIMVTSAHDQYAPVLVEFCCQLLDLIVQTKDLFNQI